MTPQFDARRVHIQGDRNRTDPRCRLPSLSLRRISTGMGRIISRGVKG